MYPRLSAAFSRYSPVHGVSFEGYIITTLRMAYKEYKLRESCRNETETAYWLETTRDMLVYEDETEYCIKANPNKEQLDQLTDKQILILLLKSYYFVSDELLTTITNYLNYKKEDIEKMFHELHTMRAEHNILIRSLRNRCHSQHYRCLAFERKLMKSEEGSPRHIRLYNMLKRGKIRLSRMRRRLNRMRAEPSNKQVANVLGIAKGTVDSTLYLIKRKFVSGVNAEQSC